MCAPSALFALRFPLPRLMIILKNVKFYILGTASLRFTRQVTLLLAWELYWEGSRHFWVTLVKNGYAICDVICALNNH